MNERQEKLLKYIKKQGEAKIKELSAVMGNYTDMTLWRDLKMLEENGYIVRIRGKARIAGESNGSTEENFNLRLRQNMNSKNEIASLTLPLIRPNHSYYFDAGSTIYTVANMLGSKGYTIVTTAVNTANLLMQGDNNITILGGQINNHTLSTSGSQALHMLSGINIDIALMATSGYSLTGGFTGGHFPEADLKQQVIKKASITVMLMDTDKMVRSHPYSFAALNDIDILIGDSMLPKDFIKEAKAAGVTVFTPTDGLNDLKRIKTFDSILLNRFL